MGTKTKYIEMDPHGKCIACWDCVRACPKGVLKKMNVIVHKHAIVGKDATECIGCLKCMKACKKGVFMATQPSNTNVLHYLSDSASPSYGSKQTADPKAIKSSKKVR